MGLLIEDPERIDFVHCRLILIKAVYLNQVFEHPAATAVYLI